MEDRQPYYERAALTNTPFWSLAKRGGRAALLASGLFERVDELDAEVRWLREALGFYADEANWVGYDGAPIYAVEPSAAQQDHGERARGILG